MWISSMRISDGPIWTAMAGLVAMKPSLSSRALVSQTGPCAGRTNSEPFSAIEHRLEDLLSVTVPVSVSISEPSIQSEISISHRSLALDVLSAEAPLEDIPFAVGESTSDVIHEDNPTAPSSGSTIR
ncbi:uncharacterized protein LOC126621423 [Malus sylvestris]|uniref:uncharacterized protein LOC126621423 n=1 Tax=Malus sylvestris TaxID=3752 RepID=UPI000498784F|nr:uncharacterized protein LOC103436006 [Malus domestica]XP_028958206.1 uncharacterized protein LOC108171627 [Malus domestica]XP_050145903.1 uncharacterized protein LOC126621423 [Malus sylvestris]